MISSVDKMLQVISKAWGKKQEGYCFLPWIDREQQEREGIRRAGFHEGRAFKWPQEKEAILAHMRAHMDHDLYWCPSLFEYENRRADLAADEHCLWADLDEVDPQQISDYPPTIAWETSPGRFQALWVLASGDLQGASWPGNENQRMTYHVGADPSGWDTTQLLRIPGWKNHKIEYRQKYGAPPEGKLLWHNGRTYQADDFDDLPDIESATPASSLVNVLADEVENVNHNEVMARVKLKLSKAIRAKIRASEAVGDRSDALWDIERSLADVGCTVAEIVAIVKNTVWNKYQGRADEMKRLILEATKAVDQRSTETVAAQQLELEREEEVGSKVPQRLGLMLQSIRPPEWLIEGILTQGGVGFIAGEPKSFKSWVALDMALSVATGVRFLDHFSVVTPGPVLYIQEEDGLPTLKTRYLKISAGKSIDRVVKVTEPDGRVTLDWLPANEYDSTNPNINALVQGDMVISEGVWQEWLDETLIRGMEIAPGLTQGYSLVIIDTLMMVAGDVEENRSQSMTTKIFRPLKQLMRKHNCALQVVHHMNKGGDSEKRGGQRLLGSVANHAWSEDSLYLQLARNRTLQLVTESKSWEGQTFRLDGLVGQRDWAPQLSPWSSADRVIDSPPPEEGGKPTHNQSKLLGAVRKLGTPTSKEVATELGFTTAGFTHNNLKTLAGKGLLEMIESKPIRWAAN